MQFKNIYLYFSDFSKLSAKLQFNTYIQSVIEHTIIGETWIRRGLEVRWDLIVSLKLLSFWKKCSMLNTHCNNIVKYQKNNSSDKVQECFELNGNMLCNIL